jgi:hypothetical protein
VIFSRLYLVDNIALINEYYGIEYGKTFMQSQYDSYARLFTKYYSGNLTTELKDFIWQMLSTRSSEMFSLMAICDYIGLFRTISSVIQIEFSETSIDSALLN